jgi:hypothetical protein
MQNGGLFEALLELDFCTKSTNFGVKTHMEAPTGVALRATPATTCKFRPPKSIWRSNSKK